jgi:hypothetical protein
MLEARTEKSYLKRAESILTRFEKETEKNRFKHIDVLFEWISGQVESWSPATRRQYKAALGYWLKARNIPNDRERWSEIFRTTVTKKQVQQAFGKRTSAKKAKHLKEQTWTALESELRGGHSKYAELTLWIVRASSVFGLRPIEWAYSGWVLTAERILGIRVKNAKATQGRSFGESRTVWLSNEHHELSQEINEAIICAHNVMEHFERLKTRFEDDDKSDQELRYRERVENELRGCRVLLGQVNRRLERRGVIPSGKRIVLYSGRHQFAADAKSAGLEPIEIAALMGHGALDTNEKHYGRKVHGKGGFAAVAEQNDMESIYDKNSSKIIFSR